LSVGIFAQKDIPEKPDSWVNDYTNLLDTNQERILNNKLNNLEKATSTQIFLAILDKIPENYYLDDYAVKMFDKWNPGRKNENNGVLIVLFTIDRKIRIEVGYGLEGVLTDLQAGRVIDDVMKPEFKKGISIKENQDQTSIIQFFYCIGADYDHPNDTYTGKKHTRGNDRLKVFLKMF